MMKKPDVESIEGLTVVFGFTETAAAGCAVGRTASFFLIGGEVGSEVALAVFQSNPPADSEYIVGSADFQLVQP